MDDSGWRSILSLVATIGAAIPALYALTAGRHTLGKAERLTKLAQTMVPSSARTLVEDVRDELAVEWSLIQWAPRYRAKQVWSWALWVLGGLSLLIFVLFAITKQAFSWTWGSYTVALLLMGGALYVKARRDFARRSWMDSERAQRWIRPPISQR